MGPAQEVPAGSVALRQRTLLGHPVGLYVLFFTEMWERFSYYGMRGLLILYMVNYFHWAPGRASTVYKWYTSLVYLTPLLGGFLADRFLGNKRAVVIGAVLMAIGHFLMAFEAIEIFFAALVFLILGNGFFKPNMSTQVGRLYGANDARRDGAYTIFYMGINLGAFFSPLVCGWLAENTLGSYHSGFTMAGIGMVIGLITYLVGLPWVQELAQNTAPPLPAEEPAPAPKAPTSEAVRAVDTSTRQLEQALPEGAQDPALSPNGGEVTGADHPPHPPAAGPLSEMVAERTPSSMPLLNQFAPALFLIVSTAFAVGAPILWLVGLLATNNLIGLEIAAVCGFVSYWIISSTQAAVRDRVLTIYVLGLFVIFFWAAFEQAGNAMNLWADKVTNRFLTAADQPPPLFDQPAEGAAGATAAAEGPALSGMARFTRMFQLKPQPAAAAGAGGGGLLSAFDPVPTAWFQSINPLGIFLLAPVFAFLWTYLDRRKLNPSIPVKMGIGILLQALAFALMIGAARSENQPSSVALASPQLPPAVTTNAQGQLTPAATGAEPARPFQAGRLTWNAADHTLHLLGVLSDNDRDEILRTTTPAAFKKRLDELAKASRDAASEPFSVSVVLDEEPKGFDLRYGGFSSKAIHYDPATRTLTSTVRLAEKDVTALLVAGSDPELRDALNTLMVASTKFRVSLWWLFWFYILSTLGELCLSPVGLSMVSKLAPAKFATMLMGLWLVVTFFGNFVAGAMGETWGTVPPEQYFLIFVFALGGAGLVLLLLVRKIAGMMHGVT